MTPPIRDSRPTATVWSSRNNRPHPPNPHQTPQSPTPHRRRTGPDSTPTIKSSNETRSPSYNVGQVDRVARPVRNSLVAQRHHSWLPLSQPRHRETPPPDHDRDRPISGRRTSQIPSTTVFTIGAESHNIPNLNSNPSPTTSAADRPAPPPEQPPTAHAPHQAHNRPAHPPTPQTTAEHATCCKHTSTTRRAKPPHPHLGVHTHRRSITSTWHPKSFTRSSRRSRTTPANTSRSPWKSRNVDDTNTGTIATTQPPISRQKRTHQGYEPTAHGSLTIACLRRRHLQPAASARARAAPSGSLRSSSMLATFLSETNRSCTACGDSCCPRTNPPPVPATPQTPRLRPQNHP